MFCVVPEPLCTLPGIVALRICLINCAIIGVNKLTPECTIVDLGVSFPPYLLPYVPSIVLANMPCDHASDRLAHGLGWLPCLLLELPTCRIYDAVPQISSKFEVFFA